MTPAASPQRVIPTAAWITAAIITALSFLIITTVLEQTGVPLIARVIAPVVLPLILGGYTLLVGYVYGDARRRGMRYVMWTLLAIFLTNGIGIILYFILRDPLLAYCSRCGSGVQHGFAFCPHCGANVLPACPACRRVVQPAWTHCAWCGVAFRPA
jgi:predicted RNA-binding Zn-ribbon protein involved in translation (DUF1610 family)